MSRCLATRGIDHVVLERGTVANTWKTERWDSLTLLTPNWQSRLPDYRYEGDDPDGYMTMPEVISFIEGYADVISAPLHTNTTVTALRRSDDGFVVETDQGEWRAPTVVLASGHVQHRRTSPRSPRWFPLASRRSRRPSTAHPVSSKKGACSSSARPRQASSSRTRSSAQAGR